MQRRLRLLAMAAIAPIVRPSTIGPALLLLAMLDPVTGGGAAAWAAVARPAAALSAKGCSTSVIFGDAYFRRETTVFRATITVDCPLGVTFSAVLRSANACELRSSAGPVLRYELYADAALQSAIVSCRRDTNALHGSGRQTFVAYGRVEGSALPAGRFRDALIASISV